MLRTIIHSKKFYHEHRRYTRYVRIARCNMPNTLQYVHVTGANIETRCLRRDTAYFIERNQLRALFVLSQNRDYSINIVHTVDIESRHL